MMKLVKGTNVGEETGSKARRCGWWGWKKGLKVGVGFPVGVDVGVGHFG